MRLLIQEIFSQFPLQQTDYRKEVCNMCMFLGDCGKVLSYSTIVLLLLHACTVNKEKKNKKRKKALKKTKKTKKGNGGELARKCKKDVNEKVILSAISLIFFTDHIIECL